MKSIAQTLLFAVLIIVLGISIWVNANFRDELHDTQTQVELLQTKLDNQEIIPVSTSEYDQVKTFVDVVAKWGGLSTDEADTYIKQLNQIIELQKQVERTTPPRQHIINVGDYQNIDAAVTPYINSGWRIKQITAGSSGRLHVLVEK